MKKKNFIRKILDNFQARVKGVWRWLPAIIWMLLIFYGSSQVKVSVAGNFWLNFFFFKTLHIIEYGTLYFLFYAANKNKKLSIILAFLYALTDEFHQTFISTREGRFRDIFIDSLGISASWYLTR